VLKPDDPRQLAIDLLARSTCSVQVAAVLADRQGIFSWGWNSVGDGFGEHAEAAAIRRANKKRLTGSRIYVASRRRKSGNPVRSKPCPMCEALLRGYELYWFDVSWRDSDGSWKVQR
jgi:tRNA(Arg) A34 adenosine deaminase TadA